ncbi:MAG: matrixin family metalloprotease [Cyanobacterium sp. T60_A2020_053]|nr:matrixin family metalloprotease [Cyanobacterium sp. T60_A2020_053]
MVLMVVITGNKSSALPRHQNNLEDKLPPLINYSLPSFLVNLPLATEDNYFEEITPHQVGYLIWRDFPVKVYLESPAPDLPVSSLQAFQRWQKAGRRALDLWNKYVPLQEINNAEEADIIIYRQAPLPQGKITRNPETGLLNLPRIAAATTTIKFYLRDNHLHHRMIIHVSPHQADDYLVSNISHEMGHALGIWGHSPNPDDIMYYAHTANIPTISPRDLNTLRKIYHQSTRLGGKIMNYEL